MSNVPSGFLEAIGTALIEKNGGADGMEEAAAAAWQWLQENPQERPTPVMPIIRAVRDDSKPSLDRED